MESVMVDKVRRTEKIKWDAVGVCVSCGCESDMEDAFKWARKHAVKTGHSPTVTVTYDIHSVGSNEAA